MKTKHWEAVGEFRTVMLAFWIKREEGFNSLIRFCRRHKGTLGVSENGISIKPAVMMKNKPDLSVWSEIKGNRGCYRPKLSTKEGKAIAAEIDAIASTIPKWAELGEVLEMPLLIGLGLNTPRMAKHGKRIFIGTGPEYEPPKRLKGSLKRISDLVYEAAAAKQNT
jgi:hypothetical protein